MNRKIFTKLAGAMLLLSVAFVSEAKLHFGKSLIGDEVKTLKEGTGPGLYFIRIDSINKPVGMSSVPKWEEINGSSSNSIGQVSSTTSGGDTVVLAIDASGKLVAVNLSDFRDKAAPSNGAASKITYSDMQALMWCVTTIRDGQQGRWPIFQFRNKRLGGYVPFNKEETSYVGEDNTGCMFESNFTNMENKRPFFAYKGLDATGEVLYLTLVWDEDKKVIKSKLVPAYEFNADTVKNHLKFSIVEVGPIVLDANAFNTQLGEGSAPVSLRFSPEAPNENEDLKIWTSGLSAEDVGKSIISGAGEGEYLFLYTSEGKRIRHNIALDADTISPDDWNKNTYINSLNEQFVKFGLWDNGTSPNADALKYSAYRFVYFPSMDSMLINAYQVRHYNNKGGIVNGLYVDNGDRDQLKDMYNTVIMNRLMVRLQDLAHGSSKFLTVDKMPTNVHVQLGVGNCDPEVVKIDPFLPEGVFTIWDNRGRCLGVRVYDGALVPQWLELEPGECPDRIPSYQWVIEKQSGKNGVVKINNREFVNLRGGIEYDAYDAMTSAMANIYIPINRESRIFDRISDFNYAPLNPSASSNSAISTGTVLGAYIDVLPSSSISHQIPSGSRGGFRPVNPVNVSDPYLGFKHFTVDKNMSSPGYGKSEDGDLEGWVNQGMDYNAFLFNYKSAFGDDGYISQRSFAGDKVLEVSQSQKEAFQFRLALDFRSKPNKEEEHYGYGGYAFYPKKDKNGKDDHPKKGQINYGQLAEKNLASAVVENDFTAGIYEFTNVGNEKLTQRVSPLSRYYYELKIADFYNYRDSLEEQYVVLKGAFEDGSDAANALRYGLANTKASEQPFKYANIYLRKSYFSQGSDVKSQDEDPSLYGDVPTRTYYAILDRISDREFDRCDELGMEITGFITQVGDTAQHYGLATWRVDDANGFIKSQARTVSSVRVSTFALENRRYELYRRLNSTETDGADGEGKQYDLGIEGAPCPYDAPKTLRIYTYYNNKEYLHEDAQSGESFNKGGINFLGLINSSQYPENAVMPDGTIKHNYNLFVDTAYINRGTGPIKPQYLIGVNPQIHKATSTTEVDSCDVATTTHFGAYIRARYLINATDSARMEGSDGSDKYDRRNSDYISNGGHDRLAFVDAIHADDRLYIMGQIQKRFSEEQYTATDSTGKRYVVIEKLRELVGSNSRKPGVPSLGYYYDFSEWNDYHNDVTFSLRFVDSEARNADYKTGLGGSSNDSKRFMIESETTNRSIYGNAKIAPVQGGWVQINNGVVALSRSSYEDAIEQAEKFNIEIGTGAPSVNESVTSTGSIKVIAGVDELTVLSASGKKVTVSNVLGQTVSTSYATGDNYTVKSPKGLVIVTVEGEKSVKAIVK